MKNAPEDVIEAVSGIAASYGISALEPLIRVCRSAVARRDLTVAVLGRFKAGKSSFLNRFVGRDLLPVGVIPVTSVVTEILWGPEERVVVSFLDGHSESARAEDVADFVTEAKNPENKRQVGSVCLFVPELEAYRGLRFVDTPGLESAFVHNTEAALAWAPNVDLALVAVGVDPPLAQQDILLIQRLFEYTPRVCLLITKVDILTDTERHDVLSFVSEQLNRNFDRGIEIFPYSIRPGFEPMQDALRDGLFMPALHTLGEQKHQIVGHKLLGLVSECIDYLQLALRSTETMEAERHGLRARAIEDWETRADTKLELQLIARHTVAAARKQIEKTLTPYEKTIGAELDIALREAYPTWNLGFAQLLERFASWLRDTMTAKLAEISASHRADFLRPVRDIQRQYARVLQAFRDRLSERTMELFGVPLRTTETEFEPKSPSSPDVNIGRIFDHNWELLSPLIPVALLQRPLKRRFLQKVNDETFKNLSRLTTQWTDIVAASAAQMQREAEQRIETLVATVERLTACPTVQTSVTKSDLNRLQQMKVELQDHQD